MNNPKIAAASGLRPILDEFCRVEGQVLKSVCLMHEDGVLRGIVFHFGQCSLTVKANADDDTAEISLGDGFALDKTIGTDATNAQPWANVIGEPFGWGWVTVNEQGYCDGVLLSFRGITAQILLTWWRHQSKSARSNHKYAS